MSALDSDFVQDWRLPTVFLSTGIQHTLWRRSRSGGRCRTPREEMWRRERELGSGSFGQVYLERSISGPKKGRVRALKAIRKDVDSPAVDYARELQAAAKFSHDRYVDWFVRSFGWFEDDSHVYLSMEYLEHGDLRNFLVGPIAEPEAREITSQLVGGLVAMHRNNFVHRDLKPAASSRNILVQSPGPHWWVKIADFGISKRAEEGSTVCKTRIGTEGYCAPEVMGVIIPSTQKDKTSDRSYTAAVDTWALGAVVFKMLTHRPAFKGSYEMFRFAEGQVSFDAQAQILSSHGVSGEGSTFVQKLLVACPESRFSSEEAAAHPWLQSSAPSSRSTSRASSPSLHESSSWVNMLSSSPRVKADSNADFHGEPSLQWSTAMMESHDGDGTTIVAYENTLDSDRPGPQTLEEQQRAHPAKKVHDEAIAINRNLSPVETIELRPSLANQEESEPKRHATSSFRASSHQPTPPTSPSHYGQGASRKGDVSLETRPIGPDSDTVPDKRIPRASSPSVYVVRSGRSRDRGGPRTPSTYWTEDETNRQLHGSDSDTELPELLYTGRRRHEEPRPRYHTNSATQYMPAGPPPPRRQRSYERVYHEPTPIYRMHSPLSSRERASRSHDLSPSRPNNPPPPPLSPSPDSQDYSRFYCLHLYCPKSIDRGWIGYRRFSHCWQHIVKRHLVGSSDTPLSSATKVWVRNLIFESKKSSTFNAESTQSRSPRSEEPSSLSPIGGKLSQGSVEPTHPASGDDVEKRRTTERRHRKKHRQVRFEESSSSDESNVDRLLKEMVPSPADTAYTVIGSNASNEIHKESRVPQCDHRSCGRYTGPPFSRNDFLDHIRTKHGEDAPSNWYLDLGPMLWKAQGKQEFGKGSMRRCTNCLMRIQSECKCRWPL